MTGAVQKMVLVIASIHSKEVLERWTFDLQTDKQAINGGWEKSDDWSIDSNDSSTADSPQMYSYNVYSHTQFEHIQQILLKWIAMIYSYTHSVKIKRLATTIPDKVLFPHSTVHDSESECTNLL